MRGPRFSVHAFATLAALACSALDREPTPDPALELAVHQHDEWQTRLAQSHEHAAKLAARQMTTPASESASAQSPKPPTDRPRRSAGAPQPEPRAAEVEVLRPAVDTRRELERQLAALSIDMYSTSWCGVCTQARRYMTAQHIRFTDHDVEDDPAARARYHVLNPRHSVPTIAIDDQVMVGFSPKGFEQTRAQAALDSLDRAAKSGPKIIEVEGATQVDK